MTYRHDIKHLPPQVQHVIRNKDECDILLKKSSQARSGKTGKTVFSTSLFMRLGRDDFSNLNGIETMEVYQRFCKKHGTVWFSTNSLSAGMAEKKVLMFLNAIKQDKVVEIYFAIGKNGGGNKDIQYKAEVVDLKSNSVGILSPDKSLTPNEWKNDKKKIWIKITNIDPFTQLTTKEFIVVSTGNILADSIAHSQYQFGYAIKK